jgi:hypothetical protein
MKQEQALPLIRRLLPKATYPIKAFLYRWNDAKGTP